ncbi:hypothetical protein RRG08_058942 [Elysia crispata]|uniref:Uncharacterized protein n=1 Tax=Elysia crispata TaxID=231223 RepID=A0AAE0XRJ7_9GAST|nr:hypothetical protein RRG08_058942 [Elysia crispata]
MTLETRFKQVQKYTGIDGGGCAGTGESLHIVGLATPEWTKVELRNEGLSVTITLGLWKSCVVSKCITISKLSELGRRGALSQIKACEAMAILGMLAGGAALLLAVVKVIMMVMDKEHPKPLGLGALVCSIVSLALIVTCVVIWFVGVQQGGEAGYSLGLSIVGAILVPIGGVLSFISR